MLYQVVGAATLSIFLRHFVWAVDTFVDTFVRLSMICVRVLMRSWTRFGVPRSWQPSNIAVELRVMTSMAWSLPVSRRRSGRDTKRV
jgi:hypothetical protein